MKPIGTATLDPSVCPKMGVGTLPSKFLDHERVSVMLSLVETLPSRELSLFPLQASNKAICVNRGCFQHDEALAVIWAKAIYVWNQYWEYRIYLTRNYFQYLQHKVNPTNTGYLYSLPLCYKQRCSQHCACLKAQRLFWIRQLYFSENIFLHQKNY